MMLLISSSRPGNPKWLFWLIFLPFQFSFRCKSKIILVKIRIISDLTIFFLSLREHHMRISSKLLLWNGVKEKDGSPLLRELGLRWRTIAHSDDFSSISFRDLLNDYTDCNQSIRIFRLMTIQTHSNSRVHTG